MSELTITLLRLGYLILLWALVLTSIGVLRRDLYGTRVTSRRMRKRQPPPPAARTPEPPATPESPALRRLVVTGGPLRGTTVPLGNTAVLIGRAPDCTLVLDDDYSSQRHARVYPEGNQWFVEDIGSTNGTFIGRDRVEGPTPIGPGTQLRVGQSTLELQR